MTIPKTRQAYLDCYDFLDKALADEIGVRVKVPSEDAAIFFRMRLHMARKLNRDDNAITYEEGHPMHGASIYDRIVIRIKPGEDGWYVYAEKIPITIEETESLAVLQAEEVENEQ